MNAKPFRAWEMWLFGFITVAYLAGMLALFVAGVTR
jgi:hypothetical protein